MNSTVEFTDVQPFSNLVPAIPVVVQFVVTGIFTALYSLIFLACYVQLWLLLCLGYSRRWHPFGLLWLALIWAGLRVSLFSFYWPYFGVYPDNSAPVSQMSTDAAVLSPLLAYFLYAFPTCIQFFMLALVASFAVGISSRDFQEPAKTARRFRSTLLIFSTLFLAASAIAATLQATMFASKAIPLWLTATRVLIQDALFLLVSVLLVVILGRVAALPHVSLILESLNTGRCGLLFTGSFLVVTFATRAIYDIVALSLRSIPSFDFGWIDLSDHAEVSELLGPNAAYAVFAAVLLAWDLFPTAAVLFLFRLRRPQLIRAPGGPSSGVPALFWQVDNDNTLHEDWGYAVNERQDDNEALIAGPAFDGEARYASSPTFLSPGDEGYRPVKFGVGSE